MSFSNSLLKSSTLYAVGNFGSKILMLILSPIFTFYLSKSEFGSYDLIITTISLLYPLLSLQISDSIYRFMLNANPKTQIEVFSNGFIVTIIQFVLFFIVFSSLKFYFKIDYFYYLTLLMFGYILFPFMQQTLRGLKLNKLYAVIGIINAFSLLIFCLIFLVFFKMKISGVLISTIISYFLVVFIAFYYGKLYKLFSFKSFRFQIIKNLCVYSIPLIPNSISWFLINIANKYIILSKLGISDNGIYALSTRFPTIIGVISSVFILAWQDFIINNEPSKEYFEFAKKTLNQFIYLCLCILIILTPLSKYLVKFLFGNQFEESYKYMPLLFVAAVLSSLAAFFSAFYLKDKTTKFLLSSTLIGAFINLISSYFLIDKIGLYAPALGTCLGFLTVVILRMITVNKKYPVVHFDKSVLILVLILIFVNFIIFYDLVYINFIIVLFGFLLLFITNKDLLLKLKTKFFK